MTNEEPRSSTLRTVIPTLIALLAGYGLMQMGNTLQGTLLSVRGGIEGFAAWEIGAIGAGFWLGIVFGSLRAGRLIRRVGHIRTFAALGAVASTAALLHLLMIAPPVWIMVRALTGFCFAGLFMVVESWINGAASSQTRGQILSLYGMTGLVAGICGQLLFPAADPAQFRPFCIVSCIIALALVPIALTRAAAPQEAEGEVRISLRRLYAQSPFGVVAGFLCGVTTSAFFSLGPLWAQRRGFDNEAIAFFMASGTLGGFLMTWPLGWLSDRMDRRAVIVGAAVTAAITFLVIVAFIPSDASLSAIYRMCRSVRRDDHSNIQHRHRSRERWCNARRVCRRFGRSADRPGRWGYCRPDRSGTGNVGCRAWTVDYHHHGPAFDCPVGRLPVLVPAGFRPAHQRRTSS